MRRTVISAMTALLLATSIEAQERRTSAPPPPASKPKPRIGYAATPAPPPQPAPVQVAQPVYYYTPGGYVVNGAPYLVNSDGSVLVNFGYGYERVLRACAPVQQATSSDPYARDALGRIPAPPGIAALQAGSRGQAMGTAPARQAQACYRTDTGGRVNIITY